MKNGTVCWHSYLHLQEIQQKIEAMHQITVESNLGEQLAKLPGNAILCDSDGRALGFFSPLTNSQKIEDLQLEPPLSIAETEALRQKHRTGKPLQDILDRLGLK